MSTEGRKYGPFEYEPWEKNPFLENLLADVNRRLDLPDPAWAELINGG